MKELQELCAAYPHLAPLLKQLAAVQGARFASFVYRAKESGELARHTVILGASKEAMYRKDAETLRAALPSLAGLPKDAGEALLASIENSLAKGIGNNDAYTHGPEQGDTWLHLSNLPDVKISKNDGSVHLVAPRVSKTVIEAGTFKEVKSRPLTLAKKMLKRELELRADTFRQFDLYNITTAKMNGETLELA